VAGKHGIGLLSIGATQKDGFDALGMHWKVVEEEAAHYRTTPDRSAWRLVGPMHVAESREQARRDVEYGIAEWFYFMGKVSAVPQFKVVGETVNEMIDFVVEGGAGVIGTVEDACEQIERLLQQSGGFGCYLVMGNDWTTPEANRRSLELIARHVFPQFQGSSVGLADAERHALQRHDDLYQRQEVALAEMTKRHEDERALRAPGWTPLHPAEVADHHRG
jgi:limonene 1,2-monooxygenase